MSRVSAAIVAILTIAQAQRASAQSAEAEALFQDGRRLIKQSHLAAGCDKLAASERLESSVGTLLNLGDCNERLGKLATAWAAFRKAEAMAKRAGVDRLREAEAHRRAARLEPRLVSVVIDVSHRVDGMVVRRDGQPLDSGAWNTPLPIDPGIYTFVVSAPGYQAWRSTVEISAKHNVVRIPALERELPAPEPTWAVVAPPKAVAPPARVASASLSARELEPIASASPSRDSTAHVDATTRPPSRWTTARKIAVGMALGGGVGLATGLAFGLDARDLQSRADLRCPRSTCADQQGLQLNADAQTAARRANLMYFSGGVAIAAAAVLWLWGAPPVTPTFGDHQAGVALARRF